jgi:hypothetical protein
VELAVELLASGQIMRHVLIMGMKLRDRADELEPLALLALSALLALGPLQALGAGATRSR